MFLLETFLSLISSTHIKGFIAYLCFYLFLKYITKKFLPYKKISLIFPIIIFIMSAIIINYFPSPPFSNAEIMINFILVYTLACTLLFIIFAFENIAQGNEDNIIDSETLLMIIYCILIAVIFYAVMYTSIYRINPKSFSGVNLGNNNELMKQFFSFLYFSIVTFSTVGYGDIYPVYLVSRLIVIIEITFAFIIVVISISSFTSLKKSFNKSSPFQKISKK